MNEYERELDPDLQALESKLRQLRPRPARISLPLEPVRPASGSRFWNYAATWSSGVVVGCLIMLLARPNTVSAPTDGQAERSVAGEKVDTREHENSPEAQPKNLVAENSEPTKRLPYYESTSLQISAILRGVDRGQLAMGSHLDAAFSGPAGLRKVSTYPVGNKSSDSQTTIGPMTQSQLMDELLNGEVF